MSKVADDFHLAHLIGMTGKQLSDRATVSEKFGINRTRYIIEKTIKQYKENNQ